MRKLDFLSQPPQIYIFQQNSNKTTFGGVIFILFIFVMIFISLLYIFDYILNEKFEIEYSRYYSPITEERRELLDSDPELNPQMNFFFDGSRYIKNNYSSNFAFYDKISNKYYENVNSVNITQNVSSFQLEILYKCVNIDDNEYSLRDKDKNISLYKTYFGFDFYHPPIPPTFINRRVGYFSYNRYKVIGSIKIYNLHVDYEEYKRKDVKFLSTLANICALFVSIRGAISSIFTSLYSIRFDNHKMVKKILLKKIEKKNDEIKLYPLKDDKDSINLDNNLIDNKDDDDTYRQDNLNLEKISWFRYLLNNIYCSNCGCNTQDRIDICNEIIQKYMSYECILYNQIMFEQLLMDYRWNDNSLKKLANNNLIIMLKNLELGFT